MISTSSYIRDTLVKINMVQSLDGMEPTCVACDELAADGPGTHQRNKQQEKATSSHSVLPFA